MRHWLWWWGGRNNVVLPPQQHAGVPSRHPRTVWVAFHPEFHPQRVRVSPHPPSRPHTSAGKVARRRKCLTSGGAQGRRGEGGEDLSGSGRWRGWGGLGNTLLRLLSLVSGVSSGAATGYEVRNIILRCERALYPMLTCFFQLCTAGWEPHAAHSVVACF